MTVISTLYFCSENKQIMKRTLFILILISTWFSAISAATFKGLVKDAQTGEELIGAAVFLKDNPTIGTITGLDGTFVLKNVPEDKNITLVCSYISYETMEQPVSKNNADKIVFAMSTSALDLEGVVVVAKADKSNDNHARFMEKNAANVLNIVSAKSIQVSPDLNVANVLQRVSGVTMQRDNSGEAQYAILRGMDKRYNYTLVNGVKIPSPDNKNRYVPLNIFPSELLERLEVTKSLTADMEGDATGGAINMVMKDAPGQFSVQANLSTGYNSNFFDRDLAAFNRGAITMTSPREQFGPTYSASMNDFGKGTSTISYKTPMPNLVGGLSVGNRWFDNKLGVILAGSYQSLYKATNSVFFSDNMPQTETTVRVTSRKDREYSEHQTQYGAHAKLDYRFNDNHRLEWYNALIGMDNMQVRESKSTDLTLNYSPEKGNYQQVLETRSMLTKQQIFATTLQGNHRLDKQFSFDWSGVYSKAHNSTPDKTYITLDNLTQDSKSSITADNAERRWEKNSDRDIAGYFNMTYDHQLAFANMQIKAGGMYRDKQRTNNYVSYKFIPADGTRPEMGKDFNTLDQINWKVTAPKGSVGPLDYDAGEKIGAAYLMGRWENQLGHVILGLRAEHTNQSYFMYHPNADDSPTGSQIYWDILPSVHVKYSPKENMNIRGSYFRSINRPGFFEIVPYSIINEDYMEFGNPNLKRATIDNFDVRWEMFPRSTEQFMVGLFYKNIQNPIEEAYYTVNSRQSGYGPANLGNAQNYGIEIDVIKYVRNFGVKANYTYTYSNVNTMKTLYYKDDNGQTKAKEVAQDRPMVNQAPHMANISLMYKDTKYGWDAQLAGAYTGKKIVIASHFLDSDYWEEGSFSLDFSAEKNFKNGLSVFMKVNNLLNTPLRRYINTTNEFNSKFDMQDIESGKTLIRENRYGRTFLLGVRFKM